MPTKWCTNRSARWLLLAACWACELAAAGGAADVGAAGQQQLQVVGGGGGQLPPRSARSLLAGNPSQQAAIQEQVDQPFAFTATTTTAWVLAILVRVAGA